MVVGRCGDRPWGMTTSPPVFTAHDVPDLLAALPTFLGFTPSESLVAVATHGPRRRFGFRLRVDLPAVEQADQLADVVAGHLERQAPDGVVLIAVSDDPDLAGTMIRATMGALPPQIELVVCAWADGSRYWEPLADCPVEGLAYEAAPHHTAIVTAIAAGQEILPDRAALVAQLAACSGEVHDRMQAVTDTVVADRIGRTVRGVVPAALAELDPMLADALASPDRMSDEAVAAFAFWVSSIEVRDEVWSRIDHDSAREWLRVLTDVAGRVVAPFEQSVLSLTAFAAWLSGDGARALIAAERAAEADPGYSMADLMLELVSSGLPPSSWPTSSWTTGSWPTGGWPTGEGVDHP